MFKYILHMREHAKKLLFLNVNVLFCFYPFFMFKILLWDCTFELNCTWLQLFLWTEIFGQSLLPLSICSEVMSLLLSLQMILQQYIKSDWLEHSFQSWEQRCQVVQSAESVELLREVGIKVLLLKKLNDHSLCRVVIIFYIWHITMSGWFFLLLCPRYARVVIFCYPKFILE